VAGRWDSNLADELLGDDDARVLEELVAREREARGWAWFVTASRQMGKWAWLVGEIERGRYAASLSEYHNDLDSRRILDRVLEIAPPTTRARLSEWLAPFDERFIRYTLHAAKPIAGSADPSSLHAAASWYWRIPRNPAGEMLRDLAERGLV
jgi:hypothetical protein